MKGLLGSKGLVSSNYLEQEAAINSLSTLMSIIPGDTYSQFEKVYHTCYSLVFLLTWFNWFMWLLLYNSLMQHFINLPDRMAHDQLSENDIQVIFRL